MSQALSTEFLENLLYQTEGTSLDFKQQQYPFNGADEQQKSELLKDILAFANSWRIGEAFILIGVKANMGSRHTVLGCNDYFDDAQLQQFVNSKTNRKVVLSYEVYLVEGKKIGVIRIPKQERPIYTIKDFGKVKKEVVYYRLGSSTTIAKPDDIFRMGKDDHHPKVSQPILDLQFGNYKTQEKLGKFLKIDCISYQESQYKLSYVAKKSDPIFGDTFSRLSANFWIDLEEYTRIISLMKPIYVVITNISHIITKNIHVEILGNSSFLILKTNKNLPDKPEINFYDNLLLGIEPLHERMKEPQITVETFNNNSWKATINIGDIKPKATVWTECFYIGSLESGKFPLDVTLYGDNLSEPQKCQLEIEFEVEKQPSLTIDKLREMYQVDDDII